MYEAMLESISREERERHREQLKMRMAVGQDIGDPDRDLAPVLVFLASEAAHYITGQTIPVDGGWIMLSLATGLPGTDSPPFPFAYLRVAGSRGPVTAEKSLEILS
jgi:hypothetical protein